MHLNLLCEHGKTCAELLNLKRQAMNMYAAFKIELEDKEYDRPLSVRAYRFVGVYDDLFQKYFSPQSREYFKPDAGLMQKLTVEELLQLRSEKINTMSLIKESLKRLLQE